MSFAHLLSETNYLTFTPPTPDSLNTTLGTGGTQLLGGPGLDGFFNVANAGGGYSIGSTAGTSFSLVIPVGSSVVINASIIYSCQSDDMFDITSYNQDVAFDLIMGEDAYDSNISAVAGTFQSSLSLSGVIDLNPNQLLAPISLNWSYPLQLPSPVGVTDLYLTLRISNLNPTNNRMVKVYSGYLVAHQI